MFLPLNAAYHGLENPVNFIFASVVFSNILAIKNVQRASNSISESDRVFSVM
jgi:hypothetical protein